nr:flavin reductase family protein [uncultured Oscillibacter sp.]
MKKRISPGEMDTSIFCLQPSRPILCTTKNEDGSDHVAPFGWCTPISQRPPMLMLSLQNSPDKSQTLMNIERDGEFVINLPDMSLTDQLVTAAFDAKFGENKFDRSGFTRLPSETVRPCGIAECRAHLECRVRSIEYPGDHGVISADILSACYDEEAFRENMLIDVRYYQPVIHLQNFNIKEAPAQIHVFLRGDSVEVREVPFPKKADNS